MTSEKRYQVFVSSTFADLKDERSSVIQAIMELDGIPAGMEAFPAADEEQFDFIKKVVDDCDYYVVIVGARYGSVDSFGISYTQKECQYALEKGIPVLAFIHSRPESLPVEKSDALDAAKMKALEEFRRQLMEGRLVKMWSDPKELAGLVALSLAKAIKMHPGVGWVRGNVPADKEILAEINLLRKENESLKREATDKAVMHIQDAAGLDANFEFRGHHKIRSRSAVLGQNVPWSRTVPLFKVFDAIAPGLRGPVIKSTLNNWLGLGVLSLSESTTEFPSSVSVDREYLDAALLQLEALGLIRSDRMKTTAGKNADFSQLTEAGKRMMLERLVVRK